MGIFGASAGHFRAQIEISPCGPETRERPAYNGIRWSFVFAEEWDEDPVRTKHSEIWPEFLADDQSPVPVDVPLEGVYDARMHIVFTDRVDYYMKRIQIGQRFYCMEGARKVAAGFVTAMEA